MKTRSLVLAGLLTAALAAAEWRVATPGHQWVFPRDHWSHPGFKTEWWYFTGELQDRTAALRLGYQFTVFRVGVLPEAPDLASRWATTDLFMGHAAVIDLDTGERVFSEVLHRATPFLARFGDGGQQVVAWSRAAAGTDGTWELRWNGTGFMFSMRDDRSGLSLDLSTAPVGAATLHGDQGYSRKGAGPSEASQYYSLPRLATRGSIAWRGAEHDVTGVSWMDHEFGSNQLGGDQVGWDWFGLRLDDGRDLMLFTIRSRVGDTTFRGGTLVSPEGVARDLGDAWSVTESGSWSSDVTNATYPAAWDVAIPSAGLTLRIRPIHSEQENVSTLVPDLYYWEGATTVETDTGVVGWGFVELTGYGVGSRPPI